MYILEDTIVQKLSFFMIFIEFLVKKFKPRYHGNGQQNIGVPIGFFPFWVKANALRKFHENLCLGVSKDSRWLQRIGIKLFGRDIKLL